MEKLDEVKLGFDQFSETYLVLIDIFFILAYTLYLMIKINGYEEKVK